MRIFDNAELLHNLTALPVGDAAFEIPDVLAFADYIKDSRDFVTGLRERLDRREPQQRLDRRKPHRLTFFPYPKPSLSGLRLLAIPSVEDLIILGALAGRIAATTDPLLPASVYSCRLRATPPHWDLKKRRPAWRRYRDSILVPLHRGDVDAIGITDVASYFGSISLELLETHLRSWGCDAAAIAQLLSLLRCWQERDGLKGIPVGTDAARLLGNAFLLPADRHLERSGVRHSRWMDDFVVAGSGPQECRDAVAALDEALELLGLDRSVEKTDFYDDRRSAIAALRDELLASLQAHGDDEADSANEIRNAFDREVLYAGRPNITRLHWILGSLTNRLDSYPARGLAERPELMNVDPQYTGNYFRAVGVGPTRVVDDLLSVISKPLDDSTEALKLQLIRAMSTTTTAWGRTEADLFRRIATDQRRRPQLRSWGWRALARTTHWREREVLEGVDAEPQPSVRRAMLSTLDRAPDTLGARRFYRHARKRFRHLESTIRWLEAA